MTNAEEKFAPYFKIRWAKTVSWTLEQAAYLADGKDPDTAQDKISLVGKNTVSKYYVWLKTKALQGKLHSMSDNNVDYYSASSIWRLIKERKFSVDKEMNMAMDHMWKAPYGIPHFGMINRAVYREAGRLVVTEHPKATKTAIATAIVDLPQYYNSDRYGHIEPRTISQIEDLLKGLNYLTGKPKKEDVVKVTINLQELVEKM